MLVNYLKIAERRGVVQKPITSEPTFGFAPFFNKNSTTFSYPQWQAERRAVIPFFLF